MENASVKIVSINTQMIIGLRFTKNSTMEKTSVDRHRKSLNYWKYNILVQNFLLHQNLINHNEMRLICLQIFNQLYSKVLNILSDIDRILKKGS